ncbi:MAG: type II toxin-antitoxin system RelE/ParE family toxin, partial [Verrucomicrobiota bacterium]
ALKKARRSLVTHLKFWMKSARSMPRKIELISEAQVDLLGAVEYYEDQVEGLGLDFEQEIRSALRIIQQSPEMWPKRHQDVRWYRVERFPYVIHYKLMNDCIKVIAVAHTSRRPDYWKKRKS